MVHPLSRRLTPAALPVVAAASLAFALAAQAQPPAGTAKRDPLDAKANIPALTYESSFAHYRRSSDEKPVSWRDANDTVTRIGGWRVYAREAQQPDPAPQAKPLQATEPAQVTHPMPAGHGGRRAP
ncbi:MAG: hypothetical protein ABL900_17350 [Burkholderiaceae bacterium]